PRLGAEPIALVTVRHRLPRRVLEQRVIGGRVVGPVLPPYAERDRLLDSVGQLAQVRRDVRAGQVGTDRRVAARDVEPHPHHRHVIAVRGDAPDGHYVPEVAVRHQGGAVGAARHVVQLLERLGLVRSKDLRLGHAGHSYVTIANLPRQTSTSHSSMNRWSSSSYSRAKRSLKAT